MPQESMFRTCFKKPEIAPEYCGFVNTAGRDRGWGPQPVEPGYQASTIEYSDNIWLNPVDPSG